MSQCGLVSPVVCGHVSVKWEGDPEPVRIPLRAWRRCQAEATVADDLGGGLVGQVCEKHVGAVRVGS